MKRSHQCGQDASVAASKSGRPLSLLNLESGQFRETLVFLHIPLELEDAGACCHAQRRSGVSFSKSLLPTSSFIPKLAPVSSAIVLLPSGAEETWGWTERP